MIVTNISYTKFIDDVWRTRFNDEIALPSPDIDQSMNIVYWFQFIYLLIVSWSLAPYWDDIPPNVWVYD